MFSANGTATKLWVGHQCLWPQNKTGSVKKFLSQQNKVRVEDWDPRDGVGSQTASIFSVIFRSPTHRNSRRKGRIIGFQLFNTQGHEEKS